MSAASLTRKLSRWQAMTGGERRLFLEAALLLALLQAGLHLLPFQTVRGLLARFGVGTAKREEPDLGGRMLWCLNAASGVLHTTCLPRALAMHTLLNRRGIASDLRIGVCRRPGAPLEAHAWVEREGAVIIGELPDLSRFIQMPLAPSIGLASRKLQ